jgi:hypothetical protein
MMQMILNPCGCCYTTTTAITRAQQHQNDLQAKTVYLSLSLSCNVVAPGVQAAAARPRVEEEPTTHKNTKPRRNSTKFPSTKQTLKGTQKKQKPKT